MSEATPNADVGKEANNAPHWLKQRTHPKSNNNNLITPDYYYYQQSPAKSNCNMFSIGSSSNNHTNNTYNNNNNLNKDRYTKQIDSVCMKIKAGQRIMIIMRGPSGSGKSTLAQSLLNQSCLLEKYDSKCFIFSTDDYFYTNNRYDFRSSLLPDAHAWNQKRVREKANDGWSPIIVDNTNTQIWEMQPYVQIAVQCGYLLELIEPQTTWSKSAGKLTQKSTHQVPRETIQRMLDRFEKVNVTELLKIFNYKHTLPLPQLRLKPPLSALPASLSSAPPASLSSVPPESLSSALPSCNITQESPLSAAKASKLNALALSWVPCPQNSSMANDGVREIQNKENVSSSIAKKSLVDLLRDDDNDIPTAVDDENITSTRSLQRHRLNCPNESDGFVLLRQMYPNKQLSGLWDLFINCKGDVDWAVDILIKEDELSYATTNFVDNSLEEKFKCSCHIGEDVNIVPENYSINLPIKLMPGSVKPQRQPRSRKMMSAEHKEMQIQIENCFILGDDKYSEHTRKIRDIRNGILDQPLPITSDEQEAAVGGEAEIEDEEATSLLEIDLGNTLVNQLRNTFKWDETLGEIMPSQQPLTTKVFMPQAVAKQLYMLWAESVQNQMEEQRQQTLRDDEQFAKLLKNPKYAECSECPSNMNELLDMELAWSIYNSEQQAKQAGQKSVQQPNDIATHLTKMKLCEKFPDLSPDMVLEVFESTGNSYSKTVEFLDCDIKSELTGDELYDQAHRENEKLNEQVKQIPLLHENIGSPRSIKSAQLHEEAKCAALRDFEETRNLAAHHAQLKAECYLKVKKAINQGNGAVARYYSEIAQLHKKKIDMFNHRAANCIVEVHKHNKNNPDLLDLHYLHAAEAISCLDLFLDRHITALRNCTRVYKHVFIITGRGLHSANGVSTIKNKVKGRLGERHLRWTEVNPGLLRVKVFSASRHSKNF